MGCWNETCMVSNLPITCGDNVALTVAIQSDPGFNEYTPSQYYYMSPIFFYGKYDDYGSAEECYGIGLSIARNEFKKNGRNIDNLSDDKFVTGIARGENDVYFTSVNTFKQSLQKGGKHSINVSLGMIRQDVYSMIVDRFSWEVFTDEKDEKGYHIYKKINYQHILSLIPDTIERTRQYYKEERQIEKELGKPSFRLPFHPLPDIDWRDKNVLLKSLQHHCDDSGRDFFSRSLGEHIAQLIENNKDDEAEEILTEYAKYMILERFMHENRKVYTPSVCTSQESETKPHKLFAEILIDAGNIIDSKYDEDDDAWDEVRQVWMEQEELEF